MDSKNWFSRPDLSSSIITAENVVHNEYGPDRKSLFVSRRVLLFEIRSGIPIVRERYPDVEPETLKTFSGSTQYINLTGENPVTVVQGGFGAPSAVDVLEILIFLGCRSLIVFGLCGGIAPHLEVGDLIVPDEVIREEGTSYHYAIGSIKAAPDNNLKNTLLTYLSSKRSLKIHTGKTVTTDAVYRQTVEKEQRWAEAGILAVDMESSALMTVASYHGISAAVLLMVSDVHNLQGNKTWTWGSESFSAKKRTAILDVLDIAIIID